MDYKLQEVANKAGVSKQLVFKRMQDITEELNGDTEMYFRMVNGVWKVSEKGKDLLLERTQRSKSRARLKAQKITHCPNCDMTLNVITTLEKYCNHCDKFFYRGHEAFYTESGIIEIIEG